MKKQQAIGEFTSEIMAWESVRGLIVSHAIEPEISFYITVSDWGGGTRTQPFFIDEIEACSSFAGCLSFGHLEIAWKSRLRQQKESREKIFTEKEKNVRD
jgi:hypothetical protein